MSRSWFNTAYPMGWIWRIGDFLEYGPRTDTLYLLDGYGMNMKFGVFFDWFVWKRILVEYELCLLLIFLCKRRRRNGDLGMAAMVNSRPDSNVESSLSLQLRHTRFYVPPTMASSTLRLQWNENTLMQPKGN
ncbi:hypothetical protein Tco_1304365 [Tanacetum coccineum]